MLLAFPPSLHCHPACAVIRRIEARRCVQQVATTRIWLFLDSSSCLEHPSLGATGRARGCGGGRRVQVSRTFGGAFALAARSRGDWRQGCRSCATECPASTQGRCSDSTSGSLVRRYLHPNDKAMGQPPAPIVLHVRQQETCCIASCLGEASDLDVRGIKSCGS